MTPDDLRDDDAQFADTRPLRPVRAELAATPEGKDEASTTPDLEAQFADTRPLAPISQATLEAMADLAANEGEVTLPAAPADADEVDPQRADTGPIPAGGPAVGPATELPQRPTAVDDDLEPADQADAVARAVGATMAADEATFEALGQAAEEQLADLTAGEAPGEPADELEALADLDEQAEAIDLGELRQLDESELAAVAGEGDYDPLADTGPIPAAPATVDEASASEPDAAPTSAALEEEDEESFAGAGFNPDLTIDTVGGAVQRPDRERGEVDPWADTGPIRASSRSEQFSDTRPLRPLRDQWPPKRDGGEDA